MLSNAQKPVVWLAYVAYPVTTAAYLERALRRMTRCMTLGPELPGGLIEAWMLQNMKVPVRPHDVPTSFTPDLGELLQGVPEHDRPDLFLFVESVGGFSPVGMDKLACPTACYLIDNHVSLSSHLEWARRFDYVFIAQRAYLDEFRKVNSNSYWLPLGCDPEIHFRYPVAKQYEIGFAGGVIEGSRRWNILTTLADNFTLGYERVFWDEMSRLFSASKIVMNNAFKDDLNMRCFEALSIGSLMLADMAHGSGQDELFVPTEEYALYMDDTIIDVARYYLKHDDLRERMADNGRRVVHAAHTYAHRVRDLLAVALRGKPDTFSAAELRSQSAQTSAPAAASGSLPELRMLEVYRLPARIRSVVCYPRERYPIFQYFNELAAEFATTLSADLKNADDRIRQPDPDYAATEYDLIFVTLVSQLRPFVDNHQLVACVNDVWPHEFDEFAELTRAMPLVYVTNLTVCHRLQQRGLTNVSFMPFSISSQYVREILPDKDIDIVQYGRCNPVLDQYMKELLIQHPEINYVTTEVDPLKLEVNFISNKLGRLGRSDIRQEFMQTLARCRISLVSAPGFDNERPTEGCHTVAIRYMESASQYCHMISRHPDNDDFTDLGLNEICDRVAGYDQFERKVLEYLQQPFPEDKKQKYQAFVGRNTTRQRALQVMHDLDRLNGLRPTAVVQHISGGWDE